MAPRRKTATGTWRGPKPETLAMITFADSQERVIFFGGAPGPPHSR